MQQRFRQHRKTFRYGWDDDEHPIHFARQEQGKIYPRMFLIPVMRSDLFRLAINGGMLSQWIKMLRQVPLIAHWNSSHSLNCFITPLAYCSYWYGSSRLSTSHTLSPFRTRSSPHLLSQSLESDAQGAEVLLKSKNPHWRRSRCRSLSSFRHLKHDGVHDEHAAALLSYLPCGLWIRVCNQIVCFGLCKIWYCKLGNANISLKGLYPFFPCC